MVLSSVLACSGQAAENGEVAEPDTQLTQQDTQLTQQDAQQLEARPTVFHVVNGSPEIRSRYTLSADEGDVAIRPAAVDQEPATPTCYRIDCATLSSGETLEPETQCASTLIAPLRVDIEPGAADANYQWNGAYSTLMPRNCYTDMTFEPGTPMLATVCFGKPAGFADVLETKCTEHPFAYGQPLLEIELE